MTKCDVDVHVMDADVKKVVDRDKVTQPTDIDKGKEQSTSVLSKYVTLLLVVRVM